MTIQSVHAGAAPAGAAPPSPTPQLPAVGARTSKAEVAINAQARTVVGLDSEGPVDCTGHVDVAAQLDGKLRGARARWRERRQGVERQPSPPDRCLRPPPRGATEARTSVHTTTLPTHPRVQVGCPDQPAQVATKVQRARALGGGAMGRLGARALTNCIVIHGTRTLAHCPTPAPVPPALPHRCTRCPEARRGMRSWGRSWARKSATWGGGGGGSSGAVWRQRGHNARRPTQTLIRAQQDQV